MAEIFFGSDTQTITKKIKEVQAKHVGRVLKIELTEENFRQEIFNIGSTSLFGEEILFLVNFTECTIPELIDVIETHFDNPKVVFYSYENVDGKTKLGKFLTKAGTKLESKKENLSFKYCEELFNQNELATFETLESIRREEENLVGVFGALIYYLNNLINIFYNTNSSQKIFNFYQLKKVCSNYSEKELQKIASNFYQNDLKFKKGEINEEMMILHSTLFVLNLRHGSSQ